MSICQPDVTTVNARLDMNQKKATCNGFPVVYPHSRHTIQQTKINHFIKTGSCFVSLLRKSVIFILLPY